MHNYSLVAQVDTIVVEVVIYIYVHMGSWAKFNADCIFLKYYEVIRIFTTILGAFQLKGEILCGGPQDSIRSTLFEPAYLEFMTRYQPTK